MPVATSHADHTQSHEQKGLPGQMPRKIVVTMIGAGSFFTNSILKDVALIPGNLGGELRLIDIDANRLALAEQLMQKIVSEMGDESRWTVRASTNRRELLPGTDYIVNSIEVSGIDCVRFDNDIPLEYGISQNIGDTIGPGGLMKGLRTVPVWLDILRDARELCPKAVVLNYTNPMNMMVLAAARAVPEMKVVGLCHSVQGTSRMLAGYAEVPYEQIQWRCSGINHLAWFTEFNGPDGKSLYPVLMEKAADRTSDFAKAEPVRTDMMLHFGAFITESSGHLSEYRPYYRKRKDLLEKYTDTGYRGEESFYANNWPNWRQGQDKSRMAQISGEDPIKLERSYEYGAWIIEAIEKNVPIQIHGNVAPNDGLIANLPADGCVEVACMVNHSGIHPTKAGRLPKQMAAICDSNMRMFDLAADAAVERSKQLAAWALMLDPLTSAVCSPAEIEELTYRLFDLEAEFLPGFK
jgi:alpha-galactosidase